MIRLSGTGSFFYINWKVFWTSSEGLIKGGENNSYGNKTIGKAEKINL